MRWFGWRCTNHVAEMGRRQATRRDQAGRENVGLCSWKPCRACCPGAGMASSKRCAKPHLPAKSSSPQLHPAGHMGKFEGGTMMSSRVKTLPMTRGQIRNEYVQNEIKQVWTVGNWQTSSGFKRIKMKPMTGLYNSQKQGFIAAAEIPMPVAPHRSSSQTASTNS